MLRLCYKLPSGLFGNTRDTSVMHEKAKIVCFNYMQPQKVKLKSVQINMKHVSYQSYPQDRINTQVICRFALAKVAYTS